MQRSIALELVFPDVVRPEHAKVAVRLRRMQHVHVLPEPVLFTSSPVVSNRVPYFLPLLSPASIAPCTCSSAIVPCSKI